MQVVLERFHSGDQGTFGRVFIPDGRFFYTGELPDRNNAPNVSCIPKGRYKVLFTFSPAFKRKMYLVDGVPSRSGIRIHSANLMGDKSMGFKAQLNGCIAIGHRMGTLDGQRALLQSAPAVSLFEQAMNWEPFELEIT